MSAFLNIEEPRSRRAPVPRFALWQLGFRPFYLLASGFAALSVLLWSLQFAGWLPRPYLQGPLWHAHEMLFGFTLAVIVGFLFTAGSNWTNQPTPKGKLLAGLALLWVAGRVLVLTPFGWVAAIVATAFPLAAAVALAIPFYRARNKRNYFFVAVLAAMGAATLAVHLQQLGVVALPAWAGIQVALDLVLFVLCVMGGRVIPMFTNNGVPGTFARRHPLAEKASLGLVLALLAVDLLQLPVPVIAAVAALAAAAQLWRWSLWQPWRTVRAPLVWVLHLAYFWIPVHLALRAGAALGWVLPSAATHALTVGAIGGLVIGMITRTARGHTGLPLRADRFDIACYVLVALSALLRVLLPMAWPQATVIAVVGSALLWSAGFALYFAAYAGRLSRPRLDGRPG
jgi:uncharacterized protein involved in response to NO